MVFTGKAVYDNSVFDDIADDVSDMIGMISPDETPFLDILTQAERPATNVYHEWLEEKLGPNTVVTSTAVGSTTAASSMTVHDGSGNAVAGFLQVGMVLVSPFNEYVQVSAISGNDVSFSRAQASTTATSYGAGVTWDVLSDASLEGFDVGDDVSRPRSRKGNYCQLFHKDIIVSGTVQAVQMLGGISNEFEHQRQMRLKELIRDLEKAVIKGKSLGNTIGSASAYRTFNGVLAQITTNVTSAGSITTSVLDTAIRNAWTQGGFSGGRGLIVCDALSKGDISGFNNSRIQVIQRDLGYTQNVVTYENDFGSFEVQLNRYMPTRSAMVVDPAKIKVIPLAGRSFQYLPVARTGDSERGTILGEYVVQLMNEEGMSRVHNGVFV